jgi:hypothetical protein
LTVPCKPPVVSWARADIEKKAHKVSARLITRHLFFIMLQLLSRAL